MRSLSTGCLLVDLDLVRSLRAIFLLVGWGGTGEVGAEGRVFERTMDCACALLSCVEEETCTYSLARLYTVR